LPDEWISLLTLAAFPAAGYFLYVAIVRLVIRTEKTFLAEMKKADEQTEGVKS
jgi:hypothetical protein